MPTTVDERARRLGAMVGVTTSDLDSRGRAAPARAAAIGFATVHLDFGDVVWDGSSVDEGSSALAAACEEAGVVAVALGVNRLNAIGLDDWGAVEDLVTSAMQAAAALATPVVHLPAFRESEIHDERTLRRHADAIRLALAVGGPTGPIVATENTLDASGCLRLLDAVDDERAAVLFDCLNVVVAGHDPLAFLDVLGARIAPVAHLKDGWRGRKGEARIGAGAGRLAEAAPVLLHNQRVETIVLENDYSEDAEARAAADLAAVRRLLAAA